MQEIAAHLAKHAVILSPEYFLSSITDDTNLAIAHATRNVLYFSIFWLVYDSAIMNDALLSRLGSIRIWGGSCHLEPESFCDLRLHILYVSVERKILYSVMSYVSSWWSASVTYFSQILYFSVERKIQYLDMSHVSSEWSAVSTVAWYDPQITVREPPPFGRRVGPVVSRGAGGSDHCDKKNNALWIRSCARHAVQ